jgi:hypothetical protein
VLQDALLEDPQLGPALIDASREADDHANETGTEWLVLFQSGSKAFRVHSTTALYGIPTPKSVIIYSSRTKAKIPRTLKTIGGADIPSRVRYEGDAKRQRRR